MAGKHASQSGQSVLPDWCSDYLRSAPADDCPDMGLIASRLESSASNLAHLWKWCESEKTPKNARYAVIRAAIETAAKFPLPAKDEPILETPDIQAQRTSMLAKQAVFAEIADQLESIAQRLHEYRHGLPEVLGVTDRAATHLSVDWPQSQQGRSLAACRSVGDRRRLPNIPQFLSQLATDLQDRQASAEPYEQAALSSQKVTWKSVFNAFFLFLNDIARCENGKNANCRDSGYLPDNKSLAALMQVITGQNYPISAASVKTAKTALFKELFSDQNTE